MSRKQELNSELLRCGLPYLGGVRSLRRWQAARRRALYQEAESLHNLSVSIRQPEFVEHELWLLNHRASWFLAHAGPGHAPCYHHRRGLIREPLTLVTEPSRHRLEWPAPDDPPGGR